MSPRWSIVASLALVLAIVASAGVVWPRSAAAASASVSYDGELRGEPSASSEALTIVPAGSAVSIDGAPQNEFYPASFGATSGWLPAGALVIEKDAPSMTAVPAEPETIWEATAPRPDAGSAAWPEQAPVPLPTATTSDEAPPSPTPVPQEAQPPVAWEAVPTEAPTATAAPSPTATVAPSATATVVSSPTAAPATATAAPETAGTPEAVPTASTVSTPDATSTPTSTPAATAAPATATPATTPEAETRSALRLDGPATATDNVPLRSGPRDGDQLLFSVPAGSTVWRTGRYADGWVSADYMGIVGWVRADLLAEPLAVAPEPTATPSPAPVATESYEALGPDRRLSWPVAYAVPDPGREARTLPRSRAGAASLGPPTPVATGAGDGVAVG